MARKLSNNGLVTRRAALAGVAAAAAYGAAGGYSANAEPASDSTAANRAGPVFSATGPDAERYGATEGFPVPGLLRARLQGNPYRPEYRVGAFSHFDEIYSTRRIARAATPWMFKR
jgi:hypothetical protein